MSLYAGSDDSGLTDGLRVGKEAIEMLIRATQERTDLPSDWNKVEGLRSICCASLCCAVPVLTTHWILERPNFVFDSI